MIDFFALNCCHMNANSNHWTQTWKCIGHVMFYSSKTELISIDIYQQNSMFQQLLTKIVNSLQVAAVGQGGDGGRMKLDRVGCGRKYLFFCFGQWVVCRNL